MNSYTYLLISIVHRLRGGEFFDYILEKDYLDEMEAIHYVKQMLDAVGYLHGKNIIHLYLKVSLTLHILYF